MSFNKEQLERYSRQLVLSEIGLSGQKKIAESKVLVIGLGGLGSPAVLYLAAAGVGTLGLADGDCVDVSNLQRQVIHFTPDVGKAKVESTREKIAQINPEVRVVKYKERAVASNIAELISEYDFIIDATDNFPAKFLINDACVMNKKAFSHGGILRFNGQSMTYVPGHACYRCVFSDLPPQDAVPTGAQAGVVGAIAGMIGSLQAAEALKYILGKGTLLTDTLYVQDVLHSEFRTVAIKRNPSCAVCGEKPSITDLIDYEQPSCS